MRGDVLKWMDIDGDEGELEDEQDHLATLTLSDGIAELCVYIEDEDARNIIAWLTARLEARA